MTTRCVFVFLLCLLCVNAADILLLSVLSSISHSLWYGKLAALLANHGHKVVVLDTYKKSVDHANITHVTMSGGYGWLKMTEDLVKNDPNGLEKITSGDMLTNFLLILALADTEFPSCGSLLKSKETLKFMNDYKNKKFDLIIGDVFCPSFYGFVPFFKNPPLILATPYFDAVAGGLDDVRSNPSYVPYSFNSKTKMSFFERVLNTIYYSLEFTVNHFGVIPNHNKLMKEVFGQDCPSLNEIQKSVALVMTGYSSVLQGAKPLPQHFIPIPAFQAGPPKPLPKDIQTFLDGAKDGAILFSMGSNFKSILMSEERRKMCVSIFKSIPQRVIWKLEVENSTDFPSNVMVTKWLPQNDVLGHQNLKAFISHGGLLGTQEALYHGVPIIGIPMMFDQHANLDNLEKHGVAIKMDYKNFQEEYLRKAIHNIFNDPSYQNNMKELSAAFKDSPQTPQQRALFWIDYVLRHKNDSTNFLRSSSSDLSWYQLWLLDVVTFIALCLIVSFYIVKYLAIGVCNLLCGSKKANVKEISNKKKMS